MTDGRKRLFATFASSMLLAASALAPTPALAQTGGGGGGGGSYCYCQGSHLGGCYSDETTPCYDYCEQYRYYIYGPPPPECDPYLYSYQPVEEPSERPSDEAAEPAGR